MWLLGGTSGWGKFLTNSLRLFMEIHIGHQIQSDLKAQGRSVTWFSRQLCCSRQNCYKIFNTPIPHVVTLCAAQKALGIDYIAILKNAIEK